jgi:hypothetical protein
MVAYREGTQGIFDYNAHKIKRCVYLLYESKIKLNDRR